MAFSTFNQITTLVSSGSSPASPVTASFTCGGLSSLLVVAVMGTGTTPTFTTVSYNSVSMTQHGSTSAGGSSTYTAIFYLVNPSTGSNTISVGFTGSTTEMAIGAVCLEGMNQTTPTDATTTGTGLGANNNTTSLTVAGKTIIIQAVSSIAASGDITPTGEQKTIVETALTFFRGSMYIKAVDTAGLYYPSWTAFAISYGESVNSFDTIDGNALKLVKPIRPRAFAPGIPR